MARSPKMNNTDTGTRDRILSAALALFSNQSTSDFTLQELARKIGLHYTVLYHYFKNRSDLEAEIIEGYSQHRASRLKEVSTLEASGLGQLGEFIRLELAQPPTNLLVQQFDRPGEPYRGRIKAAFSENTRALAKLLERGIKDGSIRNCNTGLIASLIGRILNRYANQNEEVLAQAGLDSPGLAEQVSEFVRHGLLTENTEPSQVPRLPKADMPRLQTSDSNLNLIMRSFIHRLNERGYNGTSIPDVAASIGMSKTSFYRFASSKEELLNLAAHYSLALNQQVHIVARTLGQNPLETLLHTTHFSRQLLQEAPGPTLRPLIFHHLTEEHARAAWDIHRATRFDLIQLMREGIDTGWFRPLHATAVQPMLTNCMNMLLAPDSQGFDDEVNRFMLYGIAAR